MGFRCVICKKSCEEVELYDGILEDGMVLVCSSCADKENIPLIKKPSQEQLKKAEKRYSVRERMERLSGRSETTNITPEQEAIQGTISKLRIPEPKQKNSDVNDNYYWEVNMSRRRKKLSVGQLSSLTGIPAQTILEIERGKIPREYEEIFLKLESFLGINLLKKHKREILFKRNKEDEKEILRQVRERMSDPRRDEEVINAIENHKKEDRIEKIEKIEKGEFDFSNREKLQNVTLNDLVELKKSRESKENKLNEKAKEETLIGDDIDLDLEGL